MTLHLAPGTQPIPTPAMINHQPVIGAIPVPAGTGERCHQWIVMCHNPKEPPNSAYTTWHVGCDTKGHSVFIALSGQPDLSAEAAYADLTRRAAEHWPTPKQAPNTDTDNNTDHGTDETCEHCTGSGCPDVAATLTLTTRTQVRRTAGPAQAIDDILWSLQDGIARLIDINVKGSVYEIEHVDYNTPDRVSPTG